MVLLSTLILGSSTSISTDGACIESSSGSTSNLNGNNIGNSNGDSISGSKGVDVMASASPSVISLADRVRGAMLGLYIGDALAMPVHWWVVPAWPPALSLACR